MPQVADVSRSRKGLFERLESLIQKGYEKKIDAIGLDVFRIFYSLNLLFEILTIKSYKELIYDPMPFIRLAEVDWHLILGAWFVAQFLVMIGLFTRYSVLAAYILTMVCVGSSREFEYHMYFAYVAASLLMVFMPIGRTISVDNLLLKRQYGGLPRNWQQVGVINYYAITFFVLGVTYFNSVFFKIVSPMWLDGLGLWQPIATIQIGKADLYWLMDQQYLMYFLSWITMAFETLFIFLCFDKRFRLPLFLVGVGLHLGILVFFPIPYFAMGFIAILLLLVPVGLWRKFIPRAAELDDIVLPGPPDRWLYRFAAVAFIILCILNLNIFYSTDLTNTVKERLGLNKNRVDDFISRASHKLVAFSGPTMGIAHATVFLNFHFDGYDHILGLKALDGPHKGEFLPLSQPDGTVGPMLEAYTWAYYGFRYIGTHIDNERAAFGLSRGTAYWMGKTGMDPGKDTARFEVLVKKVEVADRWEPGFRQRQQAKPWLPAGTIQWANGKFSSDLKHIEAM